MRTFESSAERSFDAVALSHRGSAGKGSPASAERLAVSLRSLDRDQRDKFLAYYDRDCVDWLADLVNGRTT